MLLRLRYVVLLTWVLTWVMAAPVSAQEARPVVVDIKVQGLVRLPQTSITAKLRTRPGAPLDRNVVSEDIKRIYALGAFDDVRVAIKSVPGGISLLVAVVELPVINSIQFIGNLNIPNEDLTKVLDIQPLAIADEKAIKSNAEKLKEYYIDEGYFLTQVKTVLRPRKDNASDLIYVIHEGAEIMVKSIHLVGNRAIEDDEIKNVIRTKEGDYLSFMSKSGQFKKELLDMDVQMLKYFYGTRGHAEARVGTPVVTLAPNLEHLDITISIQEGPVFHINKVNVVGQQGADGKAEDLLYEEDFLLSRLSMQPGVIFDRSMVERDSTKLANFMKDKGYADATASSITSTTDDHRVNFTYVVQKGLKKRVGRIYMNGNTDTRDKVIRRVMKIAEGDIFNATAIRKSRAKIMRLGFFERVEIIDTPSTNPRLQDLEVRVKERQTGTFNVGAGFSSIENFMTTAQISKENFLGHGQSLSFMASLSSIRSYYAFRFHEPYFLDTRWSFSLNLYNSQELYEDFSVDKFGGSTAFGYWLTDELHMSMTYGLVDSKVDIGGRRGRSDVQLATLLDDGLTSSLMATVFYDTRNDRMLPTDGSYTHASMEWASAYFGSDNEFGRFQARTQWYFNLFWKVVLRLRATTGYIFSMNGKEIPLLERFYVGGIFDVRGFMRNSLGPSLRVPVATEPGTGMTSYTIGGNKELIFNAELEMPIIPAPVNIRGVLFFDAGNAFGEGQELDFAELRQSVGFGFRWWSPVGPLRFEWGIPLDPLPGEDPIVFEFTIGNSF